MDVPILGEDGEVRGWKTITDSTILHNKIVEQNLDHLHQASTTPLGHGEGYELFHGPD